MDAFLQTLTRQSWNYAIRTGVAITSRYAIRQCTQLLKTANHDAHYSELQMLQDRLNTKIKIISPAIDMIELISARGYTSLESAVGLTRSLCFEIQRLGRRIEMILDSKAANDRANRQSEKQHSLEIQAVIVEIRRLLERIEDAVPLINLAITTSGVKLSTALPSSVSPARLLQASTFLSAADVQFGTDSSKSVQVGPTLTLSLYMLFQGHSRESSDNAREFARSAIWKEVIHKARVKLMRTPLDAAYKSSLDESEILPADTSANEYAYCLEIVEDLNDGRVHTFEDNQLQPGPYEDVTSAGIREIIPIHEVSKIFYADTGKILNINTDTGTTSPVLLLKRDPNASPPRKAMTHDEQDADIFHEQTHTHDHIAEGLEMEDNFEGNRHQRNYSLRESNPGYQPWRLPADLDPEWLALEVYREQDQDELDAGDDESSTSSSPCSTPLRSTTPTQMTREFDRLQVADAIAPTSPYGTIRSSLSLLELLIRLTSLQQFQQASHLTVNDELLSFFLEDSAAPGGSSEERYKRRWEARQQVGFDPYAESPVKPPQQPAPDAAVTNTQNETYGTRSLRSHSSFETSSIHQSSSRFTPLTSQGMGSSFEPQGSPEPWFLGPGHDNMTFLPRHRQQQQLIPSSPSFRYRDARSTHQSSIRSLGEVSSRSSQRLQRHAKVASHGRDFDSSLGTSPGTP